MTFKMCQRQKKTLMPKSPQSRHSFLTKTSLFRRNVSTRHFTDRLSQKEQKDVLYVLDQNLEPIWSREQFPVFLTATGNGITFVLYDF